MHKINGDKAQMLTHDSELRQLELGGATLRRSGCCCLHRDSLKSKCYFPFGLFSIKAKMLCRFLSGSKNRY